MVSLDHFAFVATQAAASFLAPEASGGATTAWNAVMALHGSRVQPSTVSGGDGGTQVPRRNREDAHHAEEADTTEGIGPVHFFFLVHGHEGRPADLSYLHRALRATAQERGVFADVVTSGDRLESEDAVYGGRSGAGAIRWAQRNRRPLARAQDTATGTRAAANARHGTLVLHNAACNEGRTRDGVARGGERLAREMMAVMRAEAGHAERRARRAPSRREEAPSQPDVGRRPVAATLSIVGNSLGGLYARYAVARLAELLDDSTAAAATRADGYHLLDGRVRVHPNVFCSTASPHLGCADHTFVQIPRAAEIGVARIMGATGSDLFRLNDLLHAMATAPRFLAPLASFRTRIAYANAYGTDFPVPGETAAFLDEGSDSPHYFDESFGDGRASERGLIAATLYTPRRSQESVRPRGNYDELAAMSSSLDSLGWKKVFVDMRKDMPMSVPLPATLSAASFSNRPLQRLQSENEKRHNGKPTPVTSRELAQAIAPPAGLRPGLPLGHNAMVAFSRDVANAALHAGGRPVMDGLAGDLVDYISSWEGTEGAEGEEHAVTAPCSC